MKKESNWWRDFGEGNRVISTLKEYEGKELIIFDTETTGLSRELDVIIQLSAIKCIIDHNCQFHEIGRMNTYINPKRKLSKKIIEITGITDEHLAKFPDENTQWPAIYEFFKNASVVCGHNSPFDIGMMNALYLRHDEESFNPVVLDTLLMARELHRKDEAGSHKLGTLATHFGLNYGLAFHNSMDDVIATMRLLRLFIDEYMEKKNTDENVIHTFDNEGNKICIQKPKIQTRIKSCWAWTGYRGMQRLYVRVRYENRVLWMNQRRPYEWGEKDAGSLELFDMKDIESQVLRLYHCDTLDELSKVRESKYA